MADVNFFDAFGYLWGQNGDTYTWSDAQWKQGWASVGSLPPSVEQFNEIQQITDQKLMWFFNQLKTVADAKGIVLASGDLTALQQMLASYTPDATTAIKGILKLATQALVNAGVDNTTAVTPAGLTTLLGARAFGAKPKVTLLQTAGTFTFTPTRSLVLVQQWGAGGGGGAGGNPSAGTGGGSGAYSSLWLAVTPGTAYTVINGASGTGGQAVGSTSNPGTAGGTSSFHGIVQSPGGSGGTGNGTGGGGGGTAGTGGDVTFTGNSGAGPSVTTTGGATQFGPPGGMAPFGVAGLTGYAGIATNGRFGNGGHGGVGSTGGGQTAGGGGGAGAHMITEF